MTETSARIAKICESERVDLVLDVGAHRGDWAQTLRRSGYTGRIISIEPQSAQLRHLTALAALDANWTIERFAAGAEEGTAEIHVAAESDWSSLRQTEGETRPEAVATRAEMVAIRRIDSLDLAGAQRLYVKIDVQGFEHEVLAGCSGIADRIVGVQVEANLEPLYVDQPTVDDLISDGHELGLQLAGVENGWINPRTGRELYVDLLFLHAV